MAHRPAAPFRSLHSPSVEGFAQADALTETSDRFEASAPSGPRPEQACRRAGAGETKMFTGVTSGSHHDVGMEPCEDLILTRRVDRAEEGSF